jgi:hypothetical protein
MSDAYHVVAHFVFDVDHAIADSKLLQDSLDKVTTAAEAVNNSLMNAALSLAGQIGLYGGLAGTIYSAVKAADKYEATQRSIATIFLSNGMFSGVHEFRDSMVASAAAMENMKKTAREFSLPVGDFVSTAKMIGASLISHGLDNSKLDKSTMLTRGYMKSAGLLGIDPGLAQGELLDMVGGRAHMNSRLTQRLVNETSAMRPYAGSAATTGANSGGLAKFNALTPEKRLETLTKALMQFGSNAKIVEENAKSLSNQMQRLTDNITGMFSILRPIGDALLQPLKKLLSQVNLFLESSGEQIAKTMATVISDLVSNPEKLFKDIKQLMNLKKDFNSTAHLVETVLTIQGITFALRMLGFELRGGLINTALIKMGQGLQYVYGLFTKFIGFETLFSVLGSIISYIVREVFPPLILGTAIMQGISRGWASAMIIDGKWMAANAPKIAEVTLKLREALALVMAPITLVIDGIAKLTEHLFANTLILDALLFSLERLAELLTGVGNIIVFVLGVVSASMRGMMVILDAWTDKRHFITKIKELPGQMMDGYMMVWDMFHKKKMDVDNSAVSQTSVHVDNITIQNQFKEQMEPDRIAFALRDQLIRAATNPVQASGGSLAGKPIQR